MTPNSKKSRRRYLIFATLGIFACCILPASCIFYTFWLPDLTLRLAIKTYPQATFLFDDFEYVRTDASISTHFYWTPDSRETVEKYFENVLSTKFASSGQNDIWLITSYQLNGGRPTIPPGENLRTHPSVCSVDVPHYSEEFKCISITLVRGNQSDLCQLTMVSPWEGVAKLQTPYHKCARIPKTGTLIIYKFYEDAM